MFCAEKRRKMQKSFIKRRIDSYSKWNTGTAMNIALLVGYDGTEFAGWQIQKEDRTVQGELEKAIAASFGFSARVTGSGRTDTGVHAAGQVCNFAMKEDIRIAPSRIADALNVQLPQDVRVLKSIAAADAFDSCRSAKRKTYRYRVYFSRREHPLFERFAVRGNGMPDFKKMRECAALLEGEHDFAGFSSTGSSVKTTVRTVYGCTVSEWAEFGITGLDITVCGNGFLYNMVRIMAGAILACGNGKLSSETVQAVLQGGSRDLLGKTMPAKGLTLVSVEYAIPLFEDGKESALY